MTEEIVELAAALGKREKSEALSLLCGAAEKELVGWLRDGVAPEDCGQAFPLAAAWMALGDLAAADADGVESFTAGEVSIRKGDGQARRGAFRVQARQIMRPYLRDEGFVFRGVRG